MPRSTKKFIDKKNSVTFSIVHRSQRDPLVADETAPQRVLVPILKQATDHNNTSKINPEEVKKRKEEQKKYGIFFDDDYDYLQHLQDVNKLTSVWEEVNMEKVDKKSEKPKINLPSSVFESNVEEKIGLLNKAAPTGLRLDLDPDIVAAMDDDFNYDDPENILEDNFIELANGGPIENSKEEEDDDDDSSSYDEFNGDSDVSFSDEDIIENLRPITKSKCNSMFSMSSSVIRRNSNLKLLDDIHEEVMNDFNDEEIGALDFNEIEGYMDPNSALLLQYADDFKKQKENESVSLTKIMEKKLNISDLHYNDEEGEEDCLISMTVEAREKDKWDCESILSMNNTNKNCPRIISEKVNKINKIIIDSRTGIPKNILGNSDTKLTIKNIEQFNLHNSEKEVDDGIVSIAESRRSRLSALSYRAPNETPEERRERKKNLKEYRKERRTEKKANTLAFKQEKKRQEKIIMNNRVNVQGNKIL